MWKRSDCTRVYLARGHTAHLLDPTVSTAWMELARALCGKRPHHRVEWRGTGSQDEYDRAASLALCTGCEEKSRE